MDSSFQRPFWELSFSLYAPTLIASNQLSN